MKTQINLLLTLLFLLGGLSACFKSGSPASVNGPAPDSPPLGEIILETPPPSTPPPAIAAPIASANCLTNADSLLCLFNKNPVAQAGYALLDDSEASSQVAPLQVFSAAITGNYAGKLENEFVRATRFDGVGYDVSLANSLKIPYEASRADDLAQALSYYWYSRVISAEGARLGNLPLLRRKIRIFTSDAISGWSSRRSSIHLAKRTPRLGEAFDASSLVFLMGVANADIASNGDLSGDIANETLANCGGQNGPSNRKLCCATDQGCPRALLSGAAEYFQAMTFASKPAMGELLGNRIDGLRICGIPRNISALTSLSRSAAFSACSSDAAPGHSGAMGLLFASILWELRKQAFSDGGESRVIEFDRLYIDSLAQFRSNDTIATSKTKILYIDQTIYGGRFNLRIQDEFTRRGF